LLKYPPPRAADGGRVGHGHRWFVTGAGATVVLVARVDGSAVAAGVVQCGAGKRLDRVAFDIVGYGPAIGGSCASG
jgi:hypothetical protein